MIIKISNIYKTKSETADKTHTLTFLSNRGRLLSSRDTVTFHTAQRIPLCTSKSITACDYVGACSRTGFEPATSGCSVQHSNHYTRGSPTTTIANSSALCLNDGPLSLYVSSLGTQVRLGPYYIFAFFQILILIASV